MTAAPEQLDPTTQGLVDGFVAAYNNGDVDAVFALLHPDFVRVVNRAFNDGDPAALAIPDSRALVAQYFTFLWHDDLERLVDRRFGKSTILVRMPHSRPPCGRGADGRSCGRPGRQLRVSRT